jgi:hypothetical protein
VPVVVSVWRVRVLYCCGVLASIARSIFCASYVVIDGGSWESARSNLHVVVGGGSSDSGSVRHVKISLLHCY